MWTHAYLLAVEDFIANFVPQGQPSWQPPTATQAAAMRLSNALLGKGDRADSIDKDWISEQYFDEAIVSTALFQRDWGWQLQYVVNQWRYAAEYTKLPHTHELLVAARCVREGYLVEEIRGKHLLITTPNRFVRVVAEGNCDCTEFRELNWNNRGKPKPCRHVMLGETYKVNRSLFQECYGL